jgi:four helix bundle protein
LARCGTAIGANYRSALRSRSKAEFIARMGIVEEEADESVYWLEIVTESHMLKPKAVGAILKEANEIVAIASATRKSARLSNRKSKIENRQCGPGG